MIVDLYHVSGSISLQLKDMHRAMSDNVTAQSTLDPWGSIQGSDAGLQVISEESTKGYGERKEGMTYELMKSTVWELRTPKLSKRETFICQRRPDAYL